MKQSERICLDETSASIHQRQGDVESCVLYPNEVVRKDSHLRPRVEEFLKSLTQTDS